MIFASGVVVSSVAVVVPSVGVVETDATTDAAAIIVVDVFCIYLLSTSVVAVAVAVAVALVVE